MKTLLTLLAAASIATIGFTGCASSKAQTTKCPVMAKKCGGDKPCCCPSSSAACPMKKKTSAQ